MENRGNIVYSPFSPHSLILIHISYMSCVCILLFLQKLGQDYGNNQRRAKGEYIRCIHPLA